MGQTSVIPASGQMAPSPLCEKWNNFKGSCGGEDGYLVLGGWWRVCMHVAGGFCVCRHRKRQEGWKRPPKNFSLPKKWPTVHAPYLKDVLTLLLTTSPYQHKCFLPWPLWTGELTYFPLHLRAVLCSWRSLPCPHQSFWPKLFFLPALAGHIPQTSAYSRGLSKESSSLLKCIAPNWTPHQQP